MCKKNTQIFIKYSPFFSTKFVYYKQHDEVKWKVRIFNELWNTANKTQKEIENNKLKNKERKLFFSDAIIQLFYHHLFHFTFNTHSSIFFSYNLYLHQINTVTCIFRLVACNDDKLLNQTTAWRCWRRCRWMMKSVWEITVFKVTINCSLWTGFVLYSYDLLIYAVDWIIKSAVKC